MVEVWIWEKAPLLWRSSGEDSIHRFEIDEQLQATYDGLTGD